MTLEHVLDDVGHCPRLDVPLDAVLVEHHRRTGERELALA